MILKVYKVKVQSNSQNHESETKQPHADSKKLNVDNDSFSQEIINNGVKCVYIAKTNVGANKTHEINKQWPNTKSTLEAYTLIDFHISYIAIWL